MWVTNRRLAFSSHRERGRSHVNPGRPWLMLRGALEARWSCARRALRPLTDAEWAFRKLTLGTGLCADG